MGESNFHLGTEVVEEGNLILDRDGAEPFILFGCTVRSINTTLGLTDGASSITVVVIQEAGQLFDFRKGDATSKGINDIEELNFGKFHIHGTVESWQETIISAQGSGIFEVKLKGPAHLSDLLQIARGPIFSQGNNANALLDLKIGRPVGFISLINPDFAFRGQDPIFENVIDLPFSLTRDLGKTGLRFDIIMDAIEDQFLIFNLKRYKMNMQQVRDLIDNRSGHPGDQDAAYRIPFLGSTFAEIMDTVAEDLTFQWWVTLGEIESIEIPEVRVTGIKGNVTVEPAHTLSWTNIDIEILDMTLGGVPGELSVEGLKNLHNDHVITQKDGFDGSHLGYSIFILNSRERQTLIEHDGTEFKQFWGWEQTSFQVVPFDEPKFPDKIGVNVKQTGITPPFIEEPPFVSQEIIDDASDVLRTAFDPVLSPAFHMPGTPDGQRFETSLEQMKLAINGKLEGVLSEEALEALIRYTKRFWGKVFYIPIPEEDWDNSNFGTWTLPKKMGWWEGNSLNHVYPGTFGQDTNTERARLLLRHYARADGRWINFCRLPSLDFSLEEVTWRFPAQAGGSIFHRFGERFTPSEEIYTPIRIKQRGHFLVIVLDTAMRFQSGDVFSDEGGTFDYFSELGDAKIWMAESDKRLNYGTWSSIDGIAPDTVPIGRTKIINDNNLSPWVEGFGGITNEEGFATLNNIARSRVDRFRPTRTLAETGTLEIAGLPEANLGQKIGFSIIQKIGISFGINGIKTNYEFSLVDTGVSRILLGIQKEKEKEFKKDKEEFENEIEDLEDTDELEDDFDFDDDGHEILPDDISAELNLLAEEGLEIIIDKPEGGKGKIVSRGLEGPFYNISRLNARVLKEGFGAAMDLSFVTEWNGVRNLAERDNSPGLLPIGQIVNVNIYTDLIGGAEAFIEVTPPSFGIPQGG